MQLRNGRDASGRDASPQASVPKTRTPRRGVPTNRGVILFSVFCVAILFQVRASAQSVEELLARMKEQEQVISQGLRSLEYDQEVRSWQETPKGKRGDEEIWPMIVRPGNESSFRIRDKNGNWIHGGTPDHELAKEGRQYQRTQENVSLSSLMQRYDFKLAGEGEALGVSCWCLDLTPKPNATFKSRLEKAMTHLRGKLWVSKAKTEMVQLEAELAQPLDMAWLFAKMTKLRFRLETVETPAGRAPSGYHLAYELDSLMSRYWKYQEVRMESYRPRPDGDLW